MKILVIYTGGTIGSSKKDSFVSLDDSTKGELIKRYVKDFGGDICFDEISPLNILSENLNADVLNNLIKLLLEKVNCGYDGIILTHGTDTLMYTAAALDLAIGDSVPVVLVSSNYPLEDKRANGYDNFVGAVEFIKVKSSRGVFVSYKNSGESLAYHRGDMVMRNNPYTDNVESLLNKPYAVLDNGEVNIINPRDCAPNGVGELNLSEFSNVLAISAQPGDSFSYALDDVKAVIINAYHSGTLDTASARFKDFCLCAKDKGIPVYVINIPYGNDYDSMKAYGDLGLICLPPCSFPSAYIKAWAGIPLF